MKLSISIQAHPKRREWAEQLSRQLNNCPIAYDVKRSTWHTRKLAMALAPADSDYHLVIQDDAILCEGFIEKATAFIEKIEAEYPNQPYAFQFYHGYRNGIVEEVKQADLEAGYVIRRFLAWGVAICVPTKWLGEMAKWGDTYPSQQDDTKIKHWLAHKGFHTVFPLPCLVDHRRMKENPTLVPSPDSDRYSPYFIDGVQTGPYELKIPKTIHQIWIGDPALRPKRIMNTWKMEGWSYRLWTEKEIDELGLVNRKLYDHYYSTGCWHGASDVARIEILQKYGGIYIDADSERLAPIDELTDCSFFSVWANKKDRIANGTIGSIAEHPILQAYIQAMGEARDVDPPWKTIGGTMFTEMVVKHRDERTKILPPNTFYPFDSSGVPSTTRAKNYSRHFWGSTHGLYKAGKI